MLRPEEHTAMVPHDERERLENLFKGVVDHEEARESDHQDGPDGRMVMSGIRAVEAAPLR